MAENSSGELKGISEHTAQSSLKETGYNNHMLETVDSISKHNHLNTRTWTIMQNQSSAVNICCGNFQTFQFSVLPKIHKDKDLHFAFDG